MNHALPDTRTVMHRIDPARNMARFYALWIELTLFGDVAVVREWAGSVPTVGAALTIMQKRRVQGWPSVSWLKVRFVADTCDCLAPPADPLIVTIQPTATASGSRP